jgi:carboxymethylenebutenolidase
MLWLVPRCRPQPEGSRRDFAAISASAGLMALPPRAANALEVSEADVQITTPDGVADCYFVHPSVGQHPAILAWPDIMGLRPTRRSATWYSRWRERSVPRRM